MYALFVALMVLGKGYTPIEITLSCSYPLRAFYTPIDNKIKILIAFARSHHIELRRFDMVGPCKGLFI